MSDYTVQKIPGGDDTTAFLKKALSQHPTAEAALLILFDEEGRIVGIGSNSFPTGVREEFADQLNAMLSDIHAGKGLQS